MCVKPRESMFLAVLLVGSASGATLRVPTDFSTIQSAIDAADHGDEIGVAPGIYQERIDYAGKEIRWRSSAGPHMTIIDGSGETVGTTVLIAPHVGPNALLQGFTITGGTSHGVHVVTHSDPTIRDCIFRDYSSTFVGGGLLLEGNSVVTVVNCVLIDNVASSGGGIAVIIATPTIVNCTFTRNIATSDSNFSGGGLFNLDSFITIRNSIFWGNLGPESLEEQQIGGNPVPSLFSVDYCIIHGLTYFFGGDGDIDRDPRFVDPENGELSLLPGASLYKTQTQSEWEQGLMPPAMLSVDTDRGKTLFEELRQVPIPTMLHYFLEVCTTDLGPELANLHVPVLVIEPVPKELTGYPESIRKQWKARNPWIGHAKESSLIQMEFVPNSGRFVMDDRPAIFDSLVQDFVSAHASR